MTVDLSLLLLYLLKGAAGVYGTALGGLGTGDPGFAVAAREHGDVDALKNGHHDFFDALVGVVLDGNVDGDIVPVVIELAIQGGFQLEFA